MDAGSNVSEFTASRLSKTICDEIRQSENSRSTSFSLDAVIRSAFQHHDQELLEAFPEDPGKIFDSAKYFPKYF